MSDVVKLGDNCDDWESFTSALDKHVDRVNKRFAGSSPVELAIASRIAGKSPTEVYVHEMFYIKNVKYDSSNSRSVVEKSTNFGVGGIIKYSRGRVK